MDILDFLQNEKDWIFSGIGVAFIAFFVGFVKNLGNIKNKAKSRSYYGVYEVYFYRVQNLRQIVLAKLHVKSKYIFVNKIDFIVFGESYNGYIYLKGHNIYMKLKGKSHDSDAFFVFKRPSGRFDFLVGVYAATSKNSSPVSGKIVIKRVTEQRGELLATKSMDVAEVPSEIVERLSGKSRNQIFVNDDGTRFFPEKIN